MNVFMLFAGSGPLVILTSHASIEDPALLEKLAAKGVDKFLAYGIPLDLAKARYGLHFDIVARGLSETDDLRVLDFDGSGIIEAGKPGEGVIWIHVMLPRISCSKRLRCPSSIPKT